MGNRARTAGAAIALAATAMAGAAAAGAQDLQQRLGETEQRLGEVEQREGVLTNDISRLSGQISSLQVKVADLRNREAVAQAELTAKQAELATAQARLAELRARLARALKILEGRLVAIYKSGEPDLLTVVMSAEGFDELLTGSEYLQRLEDSDAAIVGRVRELRDETESLVATVRDARDTIAARRNELAGARASLETETANLASARTERSSALEQVRSQKRDLEGDLSTLSKKVEEQLSQSSGSTLPAGPIRGGSSGFIWPVNGPISSGFGPRWGRIHEGLDIAAPGGTPIRAAKAGTIAFASYNGGYGNYTCIEHGGGLSTCYAHQQGFARTGGSVAQGTVIGYVGNTGASFGDHLHFEVRINGSAVDPLGYL